MPGAPRCRAATEPALSELEGIGDAGQGHQLGLNHDNPAPPRGTTKLSPPFQRSGWNHLRPSLLPRLIIRAELVVRGPHWKARARLAAGYGWRMLVNRPFAVGNRRMALAAMVTYLEMNCLTWECGEVEETVTVQRAAAKEIKEDQWEAWVLRNVGNRTLRSGR